MTPPSTAPLRCRLIEASDLDAVITLLGVGFPDRPTAYWRRGLERHRARALPDGVPRYGYLLDYGGEAVGVLLTLYTRVADEAGGHLRCNLSSWYVDPRFRTIASLLDGRAMRDKATTYLNVSPAPNTWAMHEARGFERYCRGQMLVVPALCRRSPNQRVEAASRDNLAMLPEGERTLAEDHATYGCRVLICQEAGRARAIVLQARRLKLRPGQRRGPTLPCLQLIFGPTGRELERWLGSIGRFLLRRGATPFLIFDAAGPSPGTVGRYFAGRAPKYAKGPRGVALGDLSYTEMVLFGP